MVEHWVREPALLGCQQYAVKGLKSLNLGGTGTGRFFAAGDLQRGNPVVMKYLFYRKNDTTRQGYFGTCWS